jgi:hypothetical protein
MTAAPDQATRTNLVRTVPQLPNAQNTKRLILPKPTATPAAWKYKPDHTLPPRRTPDNAWTRTGTTNTFRSNDGNRTWTDYKHVREPTTAPR